MKLTSSNRYTQILERAKSVTAGALNEMKATADFNYAVLSLLQGLFFYFLENFKLLFQIKLVKGVKLQCLQMPLRRRKNERINASKRPF